MPTLPAVEPHRQVAVPGTAAINQRGTAAGRRRRRLPVRRHSLDAVATGGTVGGAHHPPDRRTRPTVVCVGAEGGYARHRHLHHRGRRVSRTPGRHAPLAQRLWRSPTTGEGGRRGSFRQEGPAGGAGGGRGHWRALTVRPPPPLFPAAPQARAPARDERPAGPRGRRESARRAARR